MKSLPMLTLVVGLGIPALVMPISGCEKKSESPTPAASGASADGHAHRPGDGHNHDHDHEHDDDHDHGPTTQLGEQAAGRFTVRASRDGDIAPGGDAPVDVWITGGAGRVAAVRFWIGAQDARGSIKARAELEKDNWHTHAEVPDPLPAGSMLWVEIETDAGEKTVVGFDLKL